jgi:hypothetical protein
MLTNLLQSVVVLFIDAATHSKYSDRSAIRVISQNSLNESIPLIAQLYDASS